MRLRNATTGEVLAASIRMVCRSYARVVAALSRQPLQPHEATWNENCFTVHSIGNEAAIDIVFLDEQQRVVRTLCVVLPDQFPVACFGASTVVELEGRALFDHDVLAGDRLAVEE
jgi:hypothetical protein